MKIIGMDKKQFNLVTMFLVLSYKSIEVTTNQYYAYNHN